MTFGQKLQQLRRARGMSQEDLAGQLSVTRQTISKWELDQSTPDLPYLATISEFFGVSTDYLIKSASSAESVSYNGAAPSSAAVPQQKIQTHARLIFGSLLLLLGGAGVLCFYVMSAIDPWTYHDGYRSYDGVMGYLMAHTGTGFVFFLLCAAAIGGAALLIHSAWGAQIKSALADTPAFRKEDDQ